MCAEPCEGFERRGIDDELRALVSRLPLVTVREAHLSVTTCIGIERSQCQILVRCLD